MHLRIRGPAGMSQVTLPDTATWGELKSEISTKTSVLDFDLKYGYPPQPLDTTSFDSQTKLGDIGVKLHGEQLIVMPRDIAAKLRNPMSGSAPNPATVASLPSHNQDPPPTYQASEADAPPGGGLPLTLSKKPRNVEDDPPEIPVPGLEGVLILRVMPDDNSCMFRALGSAVLGDALDGMNELRSIVAQTIQQNPDFYTEGLLEKKPDDYCRWIQREDSWGGGIELAILSTHFDVEICSINVQDLRVDRFNEGRPSRCILVYSGIHYDVIACNPAATGPPELDRKVFEVARIEGMEDEDGGALEGARELCRVLQQRHYYTDTQGFAIKCNSCGWTGAGEKAATEHAMKSGHTDFGEA